MQAKLISKNGCVYLHDSDINEDVIAMTANEATWLSFFVQRHITSELVVQLRLAARHANACILDADAPAQDFPLK